MEDQTNVIPVNIEDEMRSSYLDYAMSVIIGRALPDARDGLKPVHRRILYAMLGEGLTSKKKFSKCAGVVGEVLKRLHPHGDAAVYDSLVRMAQPWNLRYPLIDGQGNFGSVDGDPAAAYRYTECRMKELAEFMLSDIDKETVDFIPNFDDSSTEPVVLPSRVPSLLINGAEGIAVGMASKIPPHNLKEIIAAVNLLIENPDANVEDLMQHVPGPDFPTAGTIYGAGPIKQIYRTGRGIIQLRAKIEIETIKSGSKEVQALVIDEIPYQVSKSKLIEKIAELVHDKKLEGISKLRDESDRRGMRIVIELKRDAVAEVVINHLYKLTLLQRSFGVILLAIVDGKPRVLSLKEALNQFISHRRSVITKRSLYELNKARARQHILEGFRIALDNIDEIVELIKSSESTPAAKSELQKKYSFSEIQAQNILDMPLKRLTALERKSIEDEYKEITAKIEELLKILENPEEVDKIILEENQEIVEKFGDERRTRIEEDGEEIEDEDLIVEEDMVVTISHKGYAKRCSPSVYRAQGRGGKGVQGTKKVSDDEDFISELFVASTHSHLLVFTCKGKLHWIKVHKLPEAGRTARGRALVNMLRLADDERVTAVLPIEKIEEGHFLILATRRGYIKRVDLMAFSKMRQGGIKATSLDDNDELIGAKLTDGDKDILLSTSSGKAIRFSEDDARAMGRTARGSRGIKLEERDELVNLVTVPKEDNQGIALLTVTENGYGKRTDISEYRCQSRGGKGVISIKTEGRNGKVVGTSAVTENDQTMIITSSGKIIRMSVSSISMVGRNTMGVRLVNLDEGEKAMAVGKLADAENGDEDKQ